MTKSCMLFCLPCTLTVYIKTNNVLKNSLAEKGASLFNMASVIKVVKLKGLGCNGIYCRLMASFDNNNIGQFVLPHPEFTRNQHKVT